MKKFAVIVDTPGNTWSLKAVIEDIANRGIVDIVNLGDNAGLEFYCDTCHQHKIEDWQDMCIRMISKQ